MIVISYREAIELLKKIKDNEDVSVHVNLGLEIARAMLEGSEVIIKTKDCEERIGVEEIKKIAGDRRFCFLVEGKTAKRIAFFSEETNLYYKLLPTEEAPTFEISGIRMHITKDVKPMRNAKIQTKVLKPKGIVLDTCTGLGYTAIAIAKEKNVEKVITVEKDHNVLELMKFNPWSRELFTNKKIVRIIDDLVHYVNKAEDRSFNAIMHDPPSIKITPELYSQKIYKDFFRILKPGGRLYHYVGRPGYKRKKHIIENIKRRLLRAGFKRIIDYKKNQGLLVIK